MGSDGKPEPVISMRGDSRPKVVIIGGGWGGCAAADIASNAGASVLILERTDKLLGNGLVGGIMRNNGRFTAAEELMAMGGGALIGLTDSTSRHVNVDFPHHSHASLYDVHCIEEKVKNYLIGKGVEIRFEVRVNNIVRQGARVLSVNEGNSSEAAGDVFIDATGTTGPTANCTKYGFGCVMCIIRCPTFGGRVSIAARAGAKEFVGTRKDGTPGSISGSSELLKTTLKSKIAEELETYGVAVVPVPKRLQKDISLKIKCCQQYSLKEYMENVVLLDTGNAKMMTPFIPLNELRQIDGFENVRYADPYAGGRGNSVRYMAMAEREDTLRIKGFDNFFCCGEKVGPLVGHTEAIATGAFAGYNAALCAGGLEPMELPTSISIGDVIRQVRLDVEAGVGLSRKYTFSGSVYFERMKELGLYSADAKAIARKVESAGLTSIFKKRLF